MRFLALLFVLTLSLPAFAADQERFDSAYDRVIKTGTIRCGVMVWPPYWVSDPNTKVLSGLGVDLYGEMAKLLDLKIEFKEIIIGQQTEELNKGTVDAICMDGPYVFSMMKFVDYSHPALYGPTYLYVREDETRFVTQADFNKADIQFVGMDGDISNDLATRLFPLAKLDSLPVTMDASALPLNVSTKKADVSILDPGTVNLFNKNNPGKLKIFGNGDPLVIYPIGLSVQKGDMKMLGLINVGIDAMNNTGIARSVLLKYDTTGRVMIPVAKPYEWK